MPLNLFTAIFSLQAAILRFHFQIMSAGTSVQFVELSDWKLDLSHLDFTSVGYKYVRQRSNRHLVFRNQPISGVSTSRTKIFQPIEVCVYHRT
jgi:hypothetical protein